MAYTEEQLSKLGTYRQSMADQMAKSNTAYTSTIQSINAQNDQALLAKQNSIAEAQKTLAGNNATAYATYKQATNPYGKQASQNNYGNNVSSYLQNAAYGTLLSGIGTNQGTYNTALNNANTIWNNWLASKAGLVADAESTKQTYDDNWYQYYMGLKQADDEAAEAKRQYEETLALQKAQLEEEKRQFDLSLANSSSGSSGGSGSSTEESVVVPDDTGTLTDEQKKIRQQLAERSAANAAGPKNYTGAANNGSNSSKTNNTASKTGFTKTRKINTGTTTITQYWNGKDWITK